MSGYTSPDQFLNELDSAINEALSEAGEQVVEQMKSTIFQLVYSSYTPTMYERTNRLLESPKILSKNKSSITVGISDGTEYGLLGEVCSFEDVIDEFSRGTVLMSDGIPGNEPTYRPPIPLAQTLQEDLNELENKFLARLRAKGFNIR